MSGFGPETTKMLEAMKSGQPLAVPEENYEEVGESSPPAEIDFDIVEPTESAEAVETSETEVETIIETPSLDATAIDEIWVDDGKGRKKVQLDYSNKEQIKKYAEQAYGMRKFQRERDQALAKVKEVEPKFTELQEAWSAIEKAHKTEGIKGLVNLLVGEQDAYDKHVAAVIQQRRLREEATPEELSRMDALEAAEQARRESEQIRAELKKQQEEQAAAREAAAQQALQDRITPAYKKWAFDGKLGDAELEEQYNTALWQLSLNQLKQLPENEELTPAIVNKAFQDVASRFNKVVTVQTKKKVAETVQKKKDAASTKASVMATGSKPTSADADEFRAHIKSGNLVDSMKMFLSGKVRLK